MPKNDTTEQHGSEKPRKTGSKAGARSSRTGGETPEPEIHVIAPGIICDTEARGHPTPQGRSPLELVVDASNGFIPLWARNSTLHWRFRDRSTQSIPNLAAVQGEVRELFAEALLKWGAAAPVRFTEDNDVWDFEIVIKTADDCGDAGCVLASAFFPDAGRHHFLIYPQLFSQGRKEQVDTLIHEIGHIFGLRHFFAQVSETAWPSELFGTQSKFSIMNYGSFSELTDADRDDLVRLYQSVWSGELTHINGTLIQLVKPFSALAPAPEPVVPLEEVRTLVQPRARLAHAHMPHLAGVR